ncbi:MAG: hypothetical protein R3Y06_04580 [Faecalibacterium sp.]
MKTMVKKIAVSLLVAGVMVTGVGCANEAVDSAETTGVVSEETAIEAASSEATASEAVSDEAATSEEESDEAALAEEVPDEYSLTYNFANGQSVTFEAVTKSETQTVTFSEMGEEYEKEVTVVYLPVGSSITDGVLMAFGYDKTESGVYEAFMGPYFELNGMLDATTMGSYNYEGAIMYFAPQGDDDYLFTLDSALSA